MKIALGLALSLSVAFSGEVNFGTEPRSVDIQLSGRERKLWLPRDVFVKSYASSTDQSIWVVLLHQYTNDQKTDSGYYSILVCEHDETKPNWRVTFGLFSPEMTEMFGSRTRVIELGLINNTEDVILKVSQKGRDKDPESGDVFWERWDLKAMKRMEIIRASKPFEPFE